MSIEELLFQALSESKKFLQDISDLGRKADTLMADLDECSAKVEFRQTYNSKKLKSVQKSLSDLAAITKQLQKMEIHQDEKFDASTLEELMGALKQQSTKSDEMLEHQKSKSKVRDQVGYKMLMSQAEECVVEDLKQLSEDISEEKLSPEDAEKANAALVQNQEKLKSSSSTLNAIVRTNFEILQRLGKALEVQTSTQQSLLSNLKETDSDVRIQAAVLVKEQRKLKTSVQDIQEVTAPPNDELVEKLQKESDNTRALLRVIQKLHDLVKEEQTMKLQVIEKEFQLKKTAVQKTVEPAALERMKQEIDEMKFRLGSVQSLLMDEIKSSIKTCETMEKSTAVERTIHVLNGVAAEFHSLMSKSAAEKDQEAAEIPENFLCPILQEIMVDPVLTVDGQTYERSAIEEWLKSHDTSPVTNLPLPLKQVFPNIALKNMIADWRKQHQ
eukprot:TRINITY_DN3990_c0_g1_i1.p1 TRINITY_DN3990_c0_g1~~TRINITY_DN3990_c0_g1_i1.p1  ORF type:complete len:443 (+),score=130.04 TRINITY_DN3990_c0_g1_i1:1180-2508(+)